MVPERVSKRPWLIWLIAFAGLSGTLFSALGLDMVVQLAAKPAERQLTVAAYVYLIGFVVSLSALIGAVIVLFRRRGRNHSRDRSAAV
jgi:hypothetical protein